MDLSGRSAIVTGGGGGLGAATALRLSACGVRVVALDRDISAQDRLPDDVVAVSGDVTEDGDVAAAIDAARALGPLSVLVNVAGGAVAGGRIVGRDGAPHEKAPFLRSMHINTVGTFNVTRLVAAAMASNEADDEGQRGVVINTASVAGIEGQSGQVAYAAAKGAILGMTLPLARDLASIGVRVCAIAPGPMATPVMLRIMDRLEEDPSEGIVFPPRMGRPEEFASLVEAIVRNPYLNGANIRLDAGLRLAYATDPDEG